MMQSVIVGIIIVAAACYAAWRIHQLGHAPSDCCNGCDNCILKKQVCDKKRDEKFGKSK